MSENKIRLVEVKHTSVSDGKTQVQRLLSASEICVPRMNRDVIKGRWRAFSKTETALDGDRLMMIKGMLEAIAANRSITTQRNIYYSIRGAHPDWKYNGLDLKEDKVYEALTGSLMEHVQVATDRTMQALGVWAAPRGYIKGDGYITTRVRGRVPLTAMPTLSFDLVDTDVEVDSNARKIIHFEKDAGFEGLAGQDNAIMLEAMFSTSQGYLVESANKFLADCQQRGLNIYVVHDADPHGMQMQLMYGMASQSNAYMPSSFYPLPQSAVLLGLFPRVAEALELPPEDVGEEHRKIIPNLYKIAEEHPEMKPEVQVIDEQNQQWEFQALNGLSQQAPAIYLAEALRVKNDEIKYVPQNVKGPILKAVQERKDEYVDSYISSFIDQWFRSELKQTLVTKLKEILKDKIAEFKAQADADFQKVSETSAEDYREAVKQVLVDDPKQYWDDAAGTVVRRMMDFVFKIQAKLNVNVQFESGSVDAKAEIKEPEVPLEPLWKDDIVEAIEDELVSGDNTELISKIRTALESVFGEPDQTW